MIALLIRHAHTAPVGHSLAGRQRGIGLTDAGREHVARLVKALMWAPITAVYTSPLQRAVETAMPIAAAHALDVHVRPDLTEVDFGEWTGKTLADLASDPAWQRFNSDRELACPPGGEPLIEVQRRVVRELTTLARPHAAEMIALVTHAEPIRCALAAFQGQSLDDVLAVEVAPGHVCPVGIASRVRRVLGVNLHPDEIAV